MRRKSPILRLPRKTKVGLKAQAYELLGVCETDVLLAPRIEPLLRKALQQPPRNGSDGEVEKQPDALERVWEYLETSSDDMARVLIAQKYKLVNKSQRTAVPFEAYCVAARLDTKKVLGLIFSEVFSQNQQAAELMAASAQPDIVRATIDRAIEPGGTRERDMMHKHSRFVPVPQTSVTFVKQTGKVVNGDDNSQTLAVLPPIEKTVREFSDRFNERLLNAPMPEPEDEAIEGEYEESEDDDE